MKKITAAVLCCIMLVLCLSACGEEKAPQPAPEAENTAVPEAAEEFDTQLKFTQEKAVKRDKFLENEDYTEFLSCSEAAFLVPGLKQFVIPQGISYSEKAGLYLISNYCAVPDIPSVISAVDAESNELVGEFHILMPDGSPFTSHMGGIAAAGDSVYVSAKDYQGNYQIARINLAELQQQGRHQVKVQDFINVQTKPSYLNFSGGWLFVGNFYHPKGDYELPRTFSGTYETQDGELGCYTLAYKLNEDGSFNMNGDYPEASFAIIGPDRIQGLSLSGEELCLSQSYGRKNDSSILVYSLNTGAEPDTGIKVCGEELPAYVLSSDKLIKSITAMPMTEGLCLSPDGGLMVLFESGAGKYDDGRDRTDYVWKMNIG